MRSVVFTLVVIAWIGFAAFAAIAAHVDPLPFFTSYVLIFRILGRVLPDNTRGCRDTRHPT